MVHINEFLWNKRGRDLHILEMLQGCCNVKKVPVSVHAYLAPGMLMALLHIQSDLSRILLVGAIIYHNP